MKYLRSINELFNNIDNNDNNEPKVGDYVVVKFSEDENSMRVLGITISVKPVLENSIGRIEKIHTYSYFIKFGETTWNINKNDVYDLELYENFNHRLKKYFIDDMTILNNRYYLFMVDNQDGNNLSLTKMMAYDFKEGFIELVIEDEKYNLELSDFIIIYESDDFEEITEHFKMLADVKKYNL